MALETIEPIIQKVRKALTEKFRDNLKGLILYGSWAKGTAREYSDIDLLAIFSTLDPEIRRSVDGLRWDADREVTIVTTTFDDFQREKIPLYTATKKEGKIVWGDVDRSLNPDPPRVKYAEFFKRSCEFESGKVQTAEDLLEKHDIYGHADLCFVAAKHSVQAALAMKGEGYSSKIAVLLPLARKYFGTEIAEAFKKLLDLYIKSEYGFERLTEQEARLAIDYAKKILEVYE